MKKLLFIIILLLILGISFNSCEDYLEKYPTDQVSSGTFWNSASDYKLALTACYGTMQDYLYAVGTPIWDCITDNGYNRYNYWNSQGIAQGPINSTTGGYIYSVYSTAYRYIARYNIFLKNLMEYKGDDLTAQDKTAYEAEVRFMRAFQYFQLYQFYGSVPLVTEPVSFENMLIPKTDAAKILNQVNSDIDFAIANLPNVLYSKNGGHLVKAAAQVLKARILLYDAYDDNGIAISSVMKDVKNITKDIMSQGYSLEKNYRAIWYHSSGVQNNSLEIIQSVKFLAPDNNGSFYWGSPLAWAWMDWKSVLALPNLIKEYDFIDGSPFDVSNPLYDPKNEFANRDPRLSLTFFFKDKGKFEDGREFQSVREVETPYTYWRPVDPEIYFGPKSYGGPVDTDVPTMTYAEVLLMYAEVVNEIDGPVKEVYDAINTIRSRVSMPDLPAGLSKDEMRVRIRKERRIETAFTGLRLYDLKRWKIAHIKLNMPASEGVIKRTFEKKNYLWPFSQSILDVNTALKQNPDYN